MNCVCLRRLWETHYFTWRGVTWEHALAERPTHLHSSPDLVSPGLETASGTRAQCHALATEKMLYPPSP